MQDICAAAAIAPRTFHRYFAAKEDVVAEPVRRMTALAHERIAAAPPGTPDAEVLREAMLAVGRFVIDHRELLTALRTVARESAHLRGTQPGVRPDEEHTIAELLRTRTEQPRATTTEPGAPGSPRTHSPHPRPGDWRRRLLVGCTVAALRIWYDEYLRADLDDPIAHLDEILRAVHIEPGRLLV